MEKQANGIHYQELAERLYELDTEIYEISGSKMGKVFPGNRQISVRQIVDDFEKENTEKLRDELILVANMLHILEDEEAYTNLQKEFEALKSEMQAFFADEDRIRQQISRDFTEDRFGLMYKKPTDHLVVCIARQTGAGGHEIGFRLSERLGIGFYDDNIMDLMLEERQQKFPGIGGKDTHYINQSNLIADIARNEDCVIVGRSCGHVLMVQNIPRLSVFVGAPLEKRIRRKMLITGKDRKETEDMIKRTDKVRKNSYNYYTGKKWGHADNFDVCINSACYGIDGTIDLLERLVKTTLNNNEN